MPLHPTIDPAIFALRSDFIALSLSCENAANTASDAASAACLADAIARHDAAPWAEAHLDAWRDAYRAFGAKPKRTACSAEALRKRAVRDGALPALNAVVDLYNAVSLRFAIPVGGEDAAQYRGTPHLCRASGAEPFHTTADGQPAIETPEAGEVIWRDDAGVTCRRWNWRQGPRTQITKATQEMWFVLERLDPMPLEALLEAGQDLIDGLRRLSPDLRVSIKRFDAECPLGLTVLDVT